MRKLIYLDNAATSHFKPRCVKKAFLKSLKTCANPGRSGHKLSLKNAMEVYKARETISNHFNCPNPNLVIFTKNCTEALNLAILGLLNSNNSSFDKKHVICSCFEHNSVLRPLNYLVNKDLIDLTIISPSNNKNITDVDVKNFIRKNTFMVCLTHISNVSGAENEIENIGKLCKQKNVLFLLDCAQSAGHKKIDMQKLNINFLAFAGHKGFFSPQGIGGLVINSTVLPNPINYGGTGTESINLSQPSSPPECFESGTIMTPLINSLNSGIKYVEKHFEKHNKKVENLTGYLLEKLTQLETIGLIKLLSPTDVKYGVVSFNLNNYDSVEISSILDEKFNIAVRGGLHCAPLTHKFFNSINTGAIRVSLNFKNTKREINKLISSLKLISKNKKIPKD